MYSSRKIEDLRPDVAANCRVFLAKCEAAGLPVLVTDTVRDDAYQLQCFARGYSKSKRPAFHAQGVGLAFDFCKNVKGQEFSDADFFHKCGEIGESVGFEWGGRWRSFPDRPHLQWSGARKNYKSADIWAGRLPPEMPLCEGEFGLSRDEILQLVRGEIALALSNADDRVERAQNRPVSPWAADAWAKATKAGIVDGTKPNGAMTREQCAVVLDRLGLLERAHEE